MGEKWTDTRTQCLHDCSYEARKIDSKNILISLPSSIQTDDRTQRQATSIHHSFILRWFLKERIITHTAPLDNFR